MSISINRWFNGRSPVVIVCLTRCLIWLALGMLAFACVPMRWSASAISSPAPECTPSAVNASPAPRFAESNSVTKPGASVQRPQVLRFSVNPVLPGDRFVIYGMDFDPKAKNNTVIFTDSLSFTTPQPALALVEKVDGTTELTVITPYGAGSGTISVETVQGGIGVSTNTITVTTAVSGYVLDADNNQVVVNGATVQFPPNNPSASDDTSPAGAFMLLGVTPGNARDINVNGSTATPRYGSDKRKVPVIPGRDNHYSDFMKLKKLDGEDIAVGIGASPGPDGSVAAGQGSANVAIARSLIQQSKTVSVQQSKKGKRQSGQSILDVPTNARVRFPNGATSGTLNVAFFEPERSPAPLPTRHYSSAIVQIMPFGVVIEGGAKLIFPNRDRLPAKSEAQLFRFEQKEGNQYLGSFVKAGWAKVSDDGQWVETANDAITETSYYFVSIERDTATVTGQVLTSHLLPSERQPIPGAIVISRGQYTHTDVKGNFKLINVPVLKQQGDKAIVETDYLRPDGKVLTTEKSEVALTASGLTDIKQAFVLPFRPFNRSPEFTAPDSLTLRVGETRNIALNVKGLENRNRSRVTVSGASFATVIHSGILWCKDYKLRLTPQAKDVGDQHKLTVTVTDSLRVRTSRTISVKVIQ